MSVLLPVPWVSQLRQGYEDPTGCWYASASMMGFFFEAGPRLGLPSLYTRPLTDGRLGAWPTGSPEAMAANPNHHQDLARNEGFEAVRECSTDYSYRLGEVETLLREQGPIFMYWFKRQGAPHHRSRRTAGDGSYGHASVIVGTNDTGLLFHDPEYVEERDGAKRTLKLEDFNKARQVWRWALMQKYKRTRDEVERRSAELRR